jgi:broad specificity phosphatase PhoE
MINISRFFKALAASAVIAITYSELSNAQEDLVANLRQGGYVIYFRHAQAGDNISPDTELPAQIKECEGERHITETGMITMKAVGDSLRAMKIPAGKVITSPACTAMETAWYALNTSVEVAPSLDGNPREQIWIELRSFLTAMPAEGTNTILFAHSTNIKALTGLAIVEGEAVIFQPDGQGGFTFIARLKPEEWASITQ